MNKQTEEEYLPRKPGNTPSYKGQRRDVPVLEGDPDCINELV
jgi:hypothetical protein